MASYRLACVAVVTALLLSTQSKCLILDNSPPSDSLIANLPVLASLFPASRVYGFLNDSSGDGSAKSLLRWDRSAPETTVRVDWTTGPSDIQAAAVVNGIIFVAEAPDPGTDDLWISRDGGLSWEKQDSPTSNESSNITFILDCGGAVVIAQANLAYNQSGSQPGYISRDSGASWSEFRAGFGPSLGGSGNIAIKAMSCDGSFLYVASSESSTMVQRASLDNLTSWSGTSTSPGVIYSDYSAITATDTGFAGLAQDDLNTTGCDVNASVDGVSTVQRSGGMPNSSYGCAGSVHFGPAGNQSLLFAAEADFINQKCYVYRFPTVSTAPSAATIVEGDCSGVTSLSTMRAILATNQGVYATFAGGPPTNTGMLFSSDGGQSFQVLDLSSVWTDSGYIIDLEQSP